MDNVMDKLCGMFHEVLEEFAADGRFRNSGDVQTAKAAVSGILKIKTLEAMQQRFDGGSYRERIFHGSSSTKEKLERLMDEAEGREKEMLKEMLSKL